ncbi:Retrovirus-related Pol polyprotein from transposon.6 [Sesamum angolense]|uniref:Retrovirus-related Pol polyprotein from transposon.6 n=1 Tax=Sesamum angolense TaxID=2727404 RepID=A0AAE2BUB2_9LAMI|nr:Retrovirus-related Pol polyprotein from transposon.6 [Sesamum angolense]
MNILDRFVVVYLDDIVIYSKSLNEHVKHLRAVFQRLREYELYVKKEKYEFCCEQITFLGHVISQGKIQMDRKKAVHQGIFEIVNPLTDLLRKDQKWERTVACDDAFRSLKQAISSQPVLKLPQFDKPFEVQVEASDRALVGVLVQDKHPVAFESHKLKDAELRYSTHEKEMMVVIHCLGAWRHYLLGTKFTIVTNNVANTYFKTQRKLSPKQARWQEFLGEFDFEWVHRSGKHNDVADAISRKLVEEYVAALTVVKFDFLDQIQESSKMDAGYLKLVEQVKSGLVQKYWLDSGYCMPKFGVPKDIVSDRDARFTVRFWTALFNMMGTELKFSTANHPQTDGQTERVNALKTGGKCSAAYRFARSKQELLDEANDSLAKTQRRMRKYADMGRRHVEFSKLNVLHW